MNPMTREDVIGKLRHYEQAKAEWLRRRIIDDGRLDILANEILGYHLQPFHLAMLHFSVMHHESLQLAFRGAGKTTSVEIVRIIHDILSNPDVRILIVSKTAGFAQDILREIKQHFMENERLRDVFGDLVDDRKWDAAEIQVRGRSKPMKESTVTCVGVGGQLIGKHFDKVYGDDLVDEDNSRTEIQRNTIKTWYYKVMHPTMEPHCELHLFGTRYHYQDLYGHLQENELADHTQIVPALDEKERSPWPEKYSSEFFKEKRKNLGVIIFNSQFQCDAEAMKGEIFTIDDLGEPVPLKSIPTKAQWYAGIDLAIKEKETADLFAMVGIAVHGSDIWITSCFTGHLGFGDQTKAIKNWWDNGMDGVTDTKHLVRFGIETNAYQDAQYQVLRKERPDMVLQSIKTIKDKVTRAHRLAARFQDGSIHICQPVWNLMVDHLLQFPGGRYKDIFDALDLAVTTAFKRKRKTRETEPGLI